jgi:hypothetical protein
MSGLLRSLQAALIDDREISLYELLFNMKVHGDLSEVFLRAIAAILIMEAADREGITVSVEELQTEADLLRETLGLHQASKTRKWLKSLGLYEEDFEVCVERRIITKKLKEKLIRDKVQPYFEAHQEDFEADELDEQTASEISDILWNDWVKTESERRNAVFTLPSIITKL